MTSTKPGPKVWTLRFKLHKTTILLYAEPNQSLSAIKTELLTALRETHPVLHIQGRSMMYQLPEDISEIQLAKMVELDDKTLFWEQIESADEDESEGMSRKGKGKATAGNDGKESKETAQSVGLIDGSVVAVRFESTAAEHNRHSNGADAEWDVLFPSQESAEEHAEDVH